MLPLGENGWKVYRLPLFNISYHCIWIYNYPKLYLKIKSLNIKKKKIDLKWNFQMQFHL